MLWNTARAFKLLFQLIHFYGQKDIPGSEIFNLRLKKPLRFPQSPIVMEGGLPYPLFKRIEACPYLLGDTLKGLGLPGRESRGIGNPLQKRLPSSSSKDSTKGS